MALTSHSDQPLSLAALHSGTTLTTTALFSNLLRWVFRREDEYEELGRIRLSITRGQAIAFCGMPMPPCRQDVRRAIGVMVSLIQMGTYVRG